MRSCIMCIASGNDGLSLGGEIGEEQSSRVGARAQSIYSYKNMISCSRDRFMRLEVNNTSGNIIIIISNV